MSSSSAASSPSPSPSSVDWPGSRTVWFGKSHLGTRFDALDEGFKAWCLHPLRKRNRWLNEDYKRWQEENGCATPPGNVIVWFGRLKGHTFRDIYNRPQYIRWLMSDENESRPWYYRVRELYDLYKLHLESHRRPHRSRRPTEHIRDLGDKVGWRDDNVPDQEDYELDGFVVADEDLEDDDYSEDEDEEGEDEEDEARETGEDDSQRSTALDEETGTQETTSSSSSSDAENASRTPPRTRSFTSHLKNDTDAQSTEPSEETPITGQ
ncbi:hypothetical protein OF83DRAFT_598051 [Amylostereum chailletii]|nr:hypothetical protein OF83DRAFT_598051 [Amylostereum chailletii]